MPAGTTKKSASKKVSSRSKSAPASRARSAGTTTRTRATTLKRKAAKAAPAKPAASTRSAAKSRTKTSSASTRTKPRSQARPARTAAAKKPAKSAAKRAGTKRSGSKSAGNMTVDHEEIQRWVESRGGHPATVIGTERRSEPAGLLRIDFPGYSGKGKLERIEWDEFFEKFEESKLAFLYDDKKNSRFSKLVARKGKRF